MLGIDLPRITSRQPRRATAERGGNGVVEFAIAFPALVFIMGSLFQLGHSFLVYNALEGVVRGGARYASVADFDAPDGTDFSDSVKNVVVYGTPSPDTEPPLVPGLSTGKVVVTTIQGGGGIPISVSVSISGFQLLKILSDITLVDKPKSTFIFMGQFKSGS